jgi:hypothetical protein
MLARIAGSTMGKQPEEFLRQKKAALIKKWFVRLLDTYPPETGKLWSAQKDPFANPIGSTFQEGLGELFDGLLAGKGEEALARALDPIIHIRAIQEFPPSRAVGFVLLLKEIVHEELASGGDPVSPEELWKFDSRIDRLSLMAFDLYTECRKKVHEIQLRELKSRALLAGEAFRGGHREKNGP